MRLNNISLNNGCLSDSIWFFKLGNSNLTFMAVRRDGVEQLALGKISDQVNTCSLNEVLELNCAVNKFNYKNISELQSLQKSRQTECLQKLRDIKYLNFDPVDVFVVGRSNDVRLSVNTHNIWIKLCIMTTPETMFKCFNIFKKLVDSIRPNNKVSICGENESIVIYAENIYIPFSDYIFIRCKIIPNCVQTNNPLIVDAFNPFECNPREVNIFTTIIPPECDKYVDIVSRVRNNDVLIFEFLNIIAKEVVVSTFVPPDYKLGSIENSKLSLLNH